MRDATKEGTMWAEKGEKGHEEMEDVQHLGLSVWTVGSNPLEGDGEGADMVDEEIQ